jgi:hypothetical protein
MEVSMMRRIAILICLVVLGAGVAASAEVIKRDQLRQYFANNDPYSRGFQAGYAAGVADASAAAYGNPGVINFNVQRCVQTQPFPTLLQLAGASLQQWLAGNDPRVNAAGQVLGAYNRCVVIAPGQDREPGQQR